MKKMYYPIFTVNGGKDFQDVYGDGRFITCFIEEQLLELEGINNAKKWKKVVNDKISINHKSIRKIENDLLNFIQYQTPNLHNINKVKIDSVSYYYSNKVYCYKCQTWYFDDDYCEC